MSSGYQTRKQLRRKRHTWPRSTVDKLETIVESPTKPKFADDRKASAQGSLGTVQEFSHSQLLWYSQILSDSQKERAKLSDKITYLERVCEKQKAQSARLQEDNNQWRANFDSIQVELFEAVQEIEEARIYVQNVETSNANLKYVVAQMKEQEKERQRRRWHHRIRRAVCSFFRCQATSSKERSEAFSIARAKTPEPFAKSAGT